MTFAAGGIPLARLILLFVGLMVEGDRPAPASFCRHWSKPSIWRTVLLLVGLAALPCTGRAWLMASCWSALVVAVMFLFFFQDWQNRVAATGVATAYVGTIQAYVGVLQGRRAGLAAAGARQPVHPAADHRGCRPVGPRG